MLSVGHWLVQSYALYPPLGNLVTLVPSKSSVPQQSVRLLFHLTIISSLALPHLQEASKIFLLATMPPATDWKCCHCGNIWSYANYAACVRCHHRTCPRCTPLAISPHPRPKARHCPREATTKGQPYTSNRVLTSSLKTSIYTCCECSDGPKAWEHQRRRIICDYIACKSCRWAK